MSRRQVALLLAAVLAAFLLASADALAGGNDIGRNIHSTLRDAAAQIFGGVIACVGLLFLINRKFTDLALYFVAAILVGWLVFSPNEIADAARAIGRQILP